MFPAGASMKLTLSDSILVLLKTGLSSKFPLICLNKLVDKSFVNEFLSLTTTDTISQKQDALLRLKSVQWV